MHRLIIRAITYLIVITFLTQDIAWAGGPDSLMPDSKRTLEELAESLGEDPSRAWKSFQNPPRIRQVLSSLAGLTWEEVERRGITMNELIREEIERARTYRYSREASTLRLLLGKMGKGEAIIAEELLEKVGPVDTVFGRIDLSRLNDIKRYTGSGASAEVARDLEIAHHMGLISIDRFRGAVGPYRINRFTKNCCKGAVSIYTPWSEWALIRYRLNELAKLKDDKEWRGVSKKIYLADDNGQIMFYEAVFGVEKLKGKHLGNLYSALPKEHKGKGKMLANWGMMNLNYTEVLDIRAAIEELAKLGDDDKWHDKPKREYLLDDNGQTMFYEAVFGVNKLKGKHLGNLSSALPRRHKYRMLANWSVLKLNYTEVLAIRKAIGELAGLGDDEKWHGIPKREYLADDNGQTMFYEEVFGKDKLKGKHLGALYSALPVEHKGRGKLLANWNKMNLNYTEVLDIRDAIYELAGVGDDEKWRGKPKRKYLLDNNGQIMFYEAVFGVDKLKGKHLGNLHSALPSEHKGKGNMLANWGVINMNYSEWVVQKGGGGVVSKDWATWEMSKGEEEELVHPVIRDKFEKGEIERIDANAQELKDASGYLERNKDHILQELQKDAEGLIEGMKRAYSLGNTGDKELKAILYSTDLSPQQKIERIYELLISRLGEVNIFILQGLNIIASCDTFHYSVLHSGFHRNAVYIPEGVWNIIKKNPQQLAAALMHEAGDLLFNRHNVLSNTLERVILGDEDGLMPIFSKLLAGRINQALGRLTKLTWEEAERRGVSINELIREEIGRAGVHPGLSYSGEASTIKELLGRMEKGEALIAPQLLNGLRPIDTVFGRVDLSRLNDINRYTGSGASAEIARDLEIAHHMGLIRIDRFRGIVGTTRVINSVAKKYCNSAVSIYTPWSEWALIRYRLDELARLGDDEEWQGKPKREYLADDNGQIMFYEAVFGVEKLKGKHLGSLYSALPKEHKGRGKVLANWSMLNLNYTEVLEIRDAIDELTKLEDDKIWRGKPKKEYLADDNGQIMFYEAVFGVDRLKGKHLGNLYSALPKEYKDNILANWSVMSLNYTEVLKIRKAIGELAGLGDDEEWRGKPKRKYLLDDNGQIMFYEAVFGVDRLRGKHLAMLYSALPKEYKDNILANWSVKSLNYTEVLKIRKAIGELAKLRDDEIWHDKPKREYLQDDNGQILFYEAVFGLDKVKGKHLGNLYSALPVEYKGKGKMLANWSEMQLNYTEVLAIRDAISELAGLRDDEEWQGKPKREYLADDNGQILFYKKVFGLDRLKGKHLANLYSALPVEHKGKGNMLANWRVINMNYSEWVVQQGNPPGSTPAALNVLVKYFSEGQGFTLEEYLGRLDEMYGYSPTVEKPHIVHPATARMDLLRLVEEGFVEVDKGKKPCRHRYGLRYTRDWHYCRIRWYMHLPDAVDVIIDKGDVRPESRKYFESAMPYLTEDGRRFIRENSLVVMEYKDYFNSLYKRGKVFFSVDPRRFDSTIIIGQRLWDCIKDIPQALGELLNCFAGWYYKGPETDTHELEFRFIESLEIPLLDEVHDWLRYESELGAIGFAKEVSRITGGRFNRKQFKETEMRSIDEMKRKIKIIRDRYLNSPGFKGARRIANRIIGGEMGLIELKGAIDILLYTCLDSIDPEEVKTAKGYLRALNMLMAFIPIISSVSTTIIGKLLVYRYKPHRLYSVVFDIIYSVITRRNIIDNFIKSLPQSELSNTLADRHYVLLSQIRDDLVSLFKKDGSHNIEVFDTKPFQDPALLVLADLGRAGYFIERVEKDADPLRFLDPDKPTVALMHMGSDAVALLTTACRFYPSVNWIIAPSKDPPYMIFYDKKGKLTFVQLMHTPRIDSAMVPSEILLGETVDRELAVVNSTPVEMVARSKLSTYSVLKGKDYLPGTILVLPNAFEQGTDRISDFVKKHGNRVVLKSDTGKGSEEVHMIGSIRQALDKGRIYNKKGFLVQERIYPPRLRIGNRDHDWIVRAFVESTPDGGTVVTGLIVVVYRDGEKLFEYEKPLLLEDTLKRLKLSESERDRITKGIKDVAIDAFNTLSEYIAAIDPSAGSLPGFISVDLILDSRDLKPRLLEINGVNSSRISDLKGILPSGEFEVGKGFLGILARDAINSYRVPVSLYVLDRLISYTDRKGDLKERFRDYYYSLGKEERKRLDEIFEKGYVYFYLLIEYELAWEKGEEIEFVEIIDIFLQRLSALLGKDRIGFDEVFLAIYDYLFKIMRDRLGPSLDFLSMPGIEKLEDTFLIYGIGLEDRCPVGCRHCSVPHMRNGRAMGYSDLVRLLDSGKVRFPTTHPVSITYSEPLTYKSEGRDIVDVVELILERGASVGIVTSGVGVSQDRLDNILERLEGLAIRYPGRVSISLSFNLFGQMRKESYIERIIYILRKTSLVSFIKVRYHSLNKDETLRGLEEVRQVIGEEKFSNIEIQERYIDPEGKTLDLYLDNPDIKLKGFRPSKGVFPRYLPEVMRDFSGFTLYPDLSISPLCSAIGRRLRTFGNAGSDGVEVVKANTKDFYTRFLRISRERVKKSGFYMDDLYVEAEMERREGLGIPQEVIVTSAVNRVIIELIRALKAPVETVDRERKYKILKNFFGFVQWIEKGRLDWQNFGIPKDELLRLVKPYFVDFFREKPADDITLSWLRKGIELGIAEPSLDMRFPAGISRKRLGEFWRRYGDFGIIEGMIGADRKFVYSEKVSKDLRRLIRRLDRLLPKLEHLPADTIVRLSSGAKHPLLYHKDDKVLEIHAILLTPQVDNKTFEFVARHDERHCVLEGIESWEELLNTYMDIVYLQGLGDSADKIINTLRDLEGENGYWRILARRNEASGDEAQQKGYLKDVIRFVYPSKDAAFELLERDINERAGPLMTLWHLLGQKSVPTPMQYLTVMAGAMLQDLTLSRRWLAVEEDILKKVGEATDPVDIASLGVDKNWARIILDRLRKKGRIEAVLYGKEKRRYFSTKAAEAWFEEGRLVLGWDERNGRVVFIPAEFQNKPWASGYIKEGFSGILWGTLLDAYKKKKEPDRDIKILQDVYNLMKKGLDSEALVTNIDIALKMVYSDVDLLGICAALAQGMDINELRGIFLPRDFQRLNYLLEQSRKIHGLLYLPLKGTRRSIQNYMNLLIQLSTDPDGEPNHSILLLVILNKLANLKELSEEEILMIYAPLCEFLGLEDIAVRFRDSWFKRANPGEYEGIKREVAEAIGGRHNKYEDIQRSLERLRQRLEEELSHLGISGVKVYARVKSPYSIKEKIGAKPEEYPDVRSMQDLLGIHVVFPKTDEYEANKTEIDAILEKIFPVTDMHSHKRTEQYGYEEYDFIGLTGGLLRVEVQVYPSSKDYRMYKTGLRAHWIYKLKRQCPDQEFDIELIEGTQNRLKGNFREDFYIIYNSLNPWVFAGVIVKDKRDRYKEKLHIVRLPRDSIDADLASARRVDALYREFLGIREISGLRLEGKVRPGVYAIEKGPFAEDRFRAIVRKSKRLRTYLVVSELLEQRLVDEGRRKGKGLLDSSFQHLKLRLDDRQLLSIAKGLGLEYLDELYILIYMISQPIEELWFGKVYQRLMFQLANERTPEGITDSEAQKVLMEEGIEVQKKMNPRVLLLAYIMTASLRGRYILNKRGIRYMDKDAERRLELLLPEYGLKNMEQLYARLGIHPDFIYNVLIRYSTLGLPMIRFRIVEDMPGIYDRVFKIMHREDIVFENPIEKGKEISIPFYPPKAFITPTIDRLLDDLRGIPGIERGSVEYVSARPHELINKKIIITISRRNKERLRGLMAGLMAELRISLEFGAGKGQEQVFIIEVTRDIPMDIIKEAITNRLKLYGIDRFSLSIEDLVDELPPATGITGDPEGNERALSTSV